MAKFLVEIESGKNNVAGLDLRILRSSRIIEASDKVEAFEKAFEHYAPGGKVDLRYSLNHFGREPDYQKVTNIKLL